MQNKNFCISIQLPDSAGQQKVSVQHIDETFELTFNNTDASIINNGYNSWSLVSGQLSQEQVNVIGQGIEIYYRSQPL
jgi:hypothetical protein